MMVKKSAIVGILGGSVGVTLAVITVIGVDVFLESECSTPLSANVNLSGCTIFGKDFSEMNLQGVNLRYSTFEAVNFKGTDMSDAVWKGQNSIRQTWKEQYFRTPI